MTRPNVPNRGPRPFRLIRYFSVAALLGIVVVVLCLFWVSRALTERNLIEHESRANTDLTRAFANVLGKKYWPFLLGSRGLTREQLLADPMLQQLRADVYESVQGTKVSKIKIYNIDGLTVFSTDSRQIGEDKGSNAGFKGALEGRVLSEITYRNHFDAVEGAVANRNFIFSYIPMRRAPQAPPEAVFEVYSDVTEMLDHQLRSQWQQGLVVLLALGGLYLFLYVAVRKADRIIVEQEAARNETERQIRHQAYHDTLTGLPNRAYFAERLDEALSQARRSERNGAVMFIDLDRFKMVNDSLGHEAGDLLLKRTAERIRNSLRHENLLFRMGGDEFMAILPEISSPEEAAHAARRIGTDVARPLQIYDHELSIGATIGIAVFPLDGDTVDRLVKNADAAMYSIKQSGRGGHAFYRAELNERAMKRLELESALRQAFARGEFQLHYQPRVDARTHRIVAVEALLRWQHPVRGLVLPDEFVDVLEEIGLMPLVGEWVLRQAGAQNKAWRAEGLAPVRVSVNVSERQFLSTQFDLTVTRVLSDLDMDPALLELELTESLLVTDPQRTRETVLNLKRLGVGVSIDDFGTGYSSLNYLRQLPIDYLKIDRSFVAEVSRDRREQAVVTAIAELGNSLGLIVVAEGVETVEQARFFADIGCNELQGFLFSRPLSAQQLAARMRADRALGTPAGASGIALPHGASAT